MMHRDLHHDLMPGASVLLACALALSGCHTGSHPDGQKAVYNNLDKSELRSITVHQDRGSGVITLTGIVGSNQRKSQAEEIARQAAPGYSIRNNLQVDSSGLQGMVKQAVAKSKSDDEIENHFKKTIQAHKNLESQDIQYTAYNGTLYLKGKVTSAEDRKQAEELARKVPQVQHVVNELQVMPEKHSTANS
jgi:hyperosmotically inducible periplasmic protein